MGFGDVGVVVHIVTINNVSRKLRGLTDVSPMAMIALEGESGAVHGVAGVRWRPGVARESIQMIGFFLERGDGHLFAGVCFVFLFFFVFFINHPKENYRFRRCIMFQNGVHGY
jgi:hypothetical protein